MYKQLKLKMLAFPKQFIVNLPLILLGIFLFWSTKFLFGTHVAVVSVLFLFAVQSLYHTIFTWGNYLKQAAMLLLSVVLGTAATLNFPCAISINLLYLFFLFYLVHNRHIPHRYYTYGLSFILVQFSRLPIQEFYNPLFAVGFCAVICGVFLFAACRLKKPKTFHPLVTLGCKNIGQSLSALLQEGEPQVLGTMMKTTTIFCKQEYLRINAQGGILDAKTEKDFKALILLTQLQKTIEETATKLPEFSAHNRVYIEALQQVFAKSKNQKWLAMELNDFVDRYRLESPALNALWKKQLVALAKLLRVIEKPIFKKSFRPAVTFQLALLKSQFNIHSLHFLSAIKQTILMTIATALAYGFSALAISNCYWLPLMVYCVLILHTKINFKPMLPRFFLVIIGIAAYGFILDSFSFDYKLVVGVIVSFVVLGLSNHPFVAAVFSSQLILTSVISTINTPLSVMLSCAFACFGFILAFFMVRLILPHRTGKHCVCWVHDILKLNLQTLNQLERMDFTERDNCLYELLMGQYLLLDEMKQNEEVMLDYDKAYFIALERYNQEFLAQMIYALAIIQPAKLPENWITYSRGKLDRLL